MHGGFSNNERMIGNNVAEIIEKPVIIETVIAMQYVLFYAINFKHKHSAILCK